MQVDDHVLEVVVDFHVERSNRAAAISHQAPAAFFGLVYLLAHAVFNRKLVFGFKACHSCKHLICLVTSYHKILYLIFKKFKIIKFIFEGT